MADLFPREIYETDFDVCWRTYRAPRAASKKDAYKAWMQTRTTRPPRDLLALCIQEYLADIKKTKQSQAHFATWLRGERWLGFMEDAQHRLDHPVSSRAARPAFKASDYPHPDTRPTKSAAEIIAAHSKP